jgi:hypothetical protein
MQMKQRMPIEKTSKQTREFGAVMDKRAGILMFRWRSGFYQSGIWFWVLSGD